MHFTHLLPVRAHRRFLGALALLAAGPGHANLLTTAASRPAPSRPTPTACSGWQCSVCGQSRSVFEFPVSTALRSFARAYRTANGITREQVQGAVIRAHMRDRHQRLLSAVPLTEIGSRVGGPSPTPFDPR